MDQYLELRPAGRLLTGNRNYLLLSPFPVSGDDWEILNGFLRYAVVPDEQIGDWENNIMFYPPARHVLAHPSNSVIEISAFKHDIYVKKG